MIEALADVGTMAADSGVADVLMNSHNGSVNGTSGSGGGPILTQTGAAAFGIGLAALGAGYAERGIGSAAVGALAEDSISTGIAVFLTVLPETLAIFALVALFV
jgi:V/A-type H+-transporting ATPase subunit K